MGCESSAVVGFDLGLPVQGQTRLGKLIGKPIGVLGDYLVKKDSYFHYIFSVIFLFYSYFLTPKIPIFLFSETHL